MPTPSFTRAAACAILSLGAASASAGDFLEPDVDVLYTLNAPTGDPFFGWVGERIGDIDGDGAPDFVVGHVLNGTDGSAAGRAFVYSGADGTLLNTVRGRPFELMGFAMSGVGDIDGDTVPDYAVSARGVPSNAGRVLVLSGADHTVIHEITGTPGAFFGHDLNAAGDVDGDGIGDLIVGARLSSSAFAGGGQVQVFAGSDASNLWTQDATAAGQSFGSAVSGIADVTGDGVPEQVAGAFNAGPGQGGQAWILDGTDGSRLELLEPLATAQSFGIFFAHDAGDVDGDGIGDVYIGDFGDTALGPFTGRGYVYSGADGSIVWDFPGEHANDGFGMGRGAGDINADGHADVLTGAFQSSDGANQGGKAYLYSGKDGGLIRTYTSTLAGAQIGFDVVRLGDVNADGIGDYVLTGNGVVQVVAGTDASPAGRIDSLCALVQSLPAEVFQPPADTRRQALCAKLDAVAQALGAGAGEGAANQLRNDVLAKMDGSLGGEPDDDWIVDADTQDFLELWVDGLIRLAMSTQG